MVPCRTPLVRTGQLLLVLLVIGAGSLSFSSSSEAARRSQGQSISLDRVLVGIMHLRDRGEVTEAVSETLELISRHPDYIPAHRLYQEMAVLSRRNGGLIEAEYRHHLEVEPGDPSRSLLHASALLNFVVVEPQRLSRPLLREIERKIARAEGAPELRSQALLLSADISRWAGDAEGFEKRLRAVLAKDKRSVTARSELVSHLARTEQWSEATELCLSLIKDAPWRLAACAALVPRRAGAAGPDQEDQDRLIVRLETIRKQRKNDPITLQSLQWFYDWVGEKRGSEELKNRLMKLEEGWTPPLRRNPYVKGLPGGELSQEALDFVEKVRAVRDGTQGSPEARIRRYGDLETAIPADPRMRAYYHRELAFALRDPAVNQLDASRESIRKALEATPDDPAVMNEWAYMSAEDDADLEEALQMVERALEALLGRPFEPMSISLGESFADFEIGLSGSVGAYLDTRGWILFKMKRYREAAQDLELAALLIPDGTVQGHLGLVRYQLGNRQGAFHSLVRALALESDDPEPIRELAAELYEESHAVSDGLDALVLEMRRQLVEATGAAVGSGEGSD
ncbi:MAG: hypothetical protein VX498_10565 [Myxococcota bacterium]|nr:hypothetical protein [Myxococcota bacterium]